MALRAVDTVVPDAPRFTRSSQFPAADTELADSLAVLAHELKSPLSTLLTTLDLLDEFESLPPEDTRTLLGRVHRSAQWLRSLVDDVSTCSAIELGVLRLDLQPVSLSDCVASAIELVRPRLDRRSQEVRVTCERDLPLVSCDRTRIGQVLVNLLENASAYSDWGDTIQVVIRRSDGEVRVEVSDHGPGIPTDELPSIFERYVRGERGHERRTQGQGLGLYLVRSLVEMHGGHVGVRSRIGQGSTFWFTLPVASPRTHNMRILEKQSS